MPLFVRTAALLLMALLLPLPACSLFGGGDEEEEAAAAPVAVQPQAVIMAEITGLEVGRTRDGIVLTAIGLAPGIGFAEPRLAARRNGLPDSQGIVDFDFVATPPDAGFNLGAGDPRARLIRADRLIGVDEMRGVAGLRVHAANGVRQIVF